MSEDSITIVVSDKANVDWIRNKVREGHFVSEDDVVTQGISSLREEDDVMARWEREVIIPRYLKYKANPEVAITIEEVEQRLEERRRQRAEQAR